MQKELCSEIMTYLYELPKLQRIALILYYYNRLSIKEIASVMDCPEGTVKPDYLEERKILRYYLSIEIKMR